MNLLQVIFTVSLLLSIVGVFGYAYEVLMGRVTRFTRWRDLNARQWTYVWLGGQMVITLPVLLIVSLA